MAYTFVGAPKNIVRELAKGHLKKTSKNRARANEGVPLKFAPKVPMVPDASPTLAKADLCQGLSPGIGSKD
jgi:hypothetical protein